MIGIIIVTHGRFGAELMKTVEMVLGPVQNVQAISLNSEDTIDSFQQSIDGALQTMTSGQGCLILADLFGGTPGNTAAMLVKHDKLHLVTGVNLSMLIEVVSLRENCTLQELSDLAVAAGKNGIQSITEIIR